MQVHENIYIYELARTFIKEYVAEEHRGNVQILPVEGDKLKLHVKVFSDAKETEFDIDLSKISRAMPLITYLLPLTTHLIGEIDFALEK